ncbi:hypothetical protein [Streptomyces sp. NPDC006368]|uniref:hypothetical protein n=1 Tax=Streptomyces sp. NPDC006368 TaxID=3156760 RepID=UPI0033AB8CB5
MPSLAAGLAVAAVLVAAGVRWAAAGDSSPGTAGPSSPAASSTAFPTAPPTAPSGDYRVSTDAGGLSVAVPRDWTYRLSGSSHTYQAPDYASFLEITPVPGPADPLETARGFSQAVRSVWSGYVETALGPVGDAPDAAVEVEFAHDATDGTRRRGIYRVFTAPDTTVYGAQVAGPSTDWPRQREIMDTLLSTFYPSGAAPTP